jgi:hypothetical protein
MRSRGLLFHLSHAESPLGDCARGGCRQAGWREHGYCLTERRKIFAEHHGTGVSSSFDFAVFFSRFGTILVPQTPISNRIEFWQKIAEIASGGWRSSQQRWNTAHHV